jgi:CheY-like chemotaxis protein
MAASLLIVDDSRVSRMMIRARVAAAHPDWAVAEAASGDEALEMAAKNAPDFVTMDVNMPGLNGFEAAQKMQNLLPNVRLAMLTANIQESSRARSDALGLRFVQKPITDASLAQVLAYFAEAPSDA